MEFYKNNNYKMKYKNKHIDNNKELRIVTYMTPSLSTEIYLTLAKYLVEFLEYNSVTLYIETKYSGPPDDKNNPFIKHDLIEPIDIGFMCSPPYLKNKKYLELIPYAPIFMDKDINNIPIYFSDVITLKEYYYINTFNDFKNKIWVYNDEESLSGYYSTLYKLSKLNTNTNFFSKFKKSNSHLNSINALLNKKITGTAIDSNVLNYYLKNNPYRRNQIKIIERWGPHGVQPIVMRKTLDNNIKKQIIKAFENIPETIIYKLNKYLIKGFGKINDNFYVNEINILKQSNLNVRENISV